MPGSCDARFASPPTLRTVHNGCRDRRGRPAGSVALNTQGVRRAERTLRAHASTRRYSSSAVGSQTKCGRTGDVRQHGDRLSHTACRTPHGGVSSNVSLGHVGGVVATLWPNHHQRGWRSQPNCGAARSTKVATVAAAAPSIVNGAPADSRGIRKQAMAVHPAATPMTPTDVWRVQGTPSLLRR